MITDPQEWAKLLERGAASKCMAALQGVSDADRKRLAGAAAKALRQATQIEANLDHATKQLRRRQADAAKLAALATCSLSEIKGLAWRIFPVDDQAIEALRDRDPDWRMSFAEYLLEGEPISWNSTRNMLKAGLISKPTHDNYVLGMTHLFAGVGGIGSDPARLGTRHDNWHVLAHLEAEPDLIDDVWRLFELEGSGEYSLAAHDKFSHGPCTRWDQSLLELSRRGTLSRDRLLQESLAALDRGFAQFRAGWFSAFHELLEPTVKERQSLTDSYLKLLASPIPPTVSFTLNALELIDQSAPIASKPFLDALQPVMFSRAKGTVKSALKLLETIGKRDPSQAARVASISATGLTHEASDVQAAALKLVSIYGDPTQSDLVSAVTIASGTVAASVRTKLTAWLENTKSSAADARPATTNAVSRPSTRSKGDKNASQSPLASPLDKVILKRIKDLPERWRVLAGLDGALTAIGTANWDGSPLDFDGTEIPHLDDARKISPIQTLDELIDLAATTIENPDDVDQIERLYDGISRLGAERPADFGKRTGPLLKRVRSLIQRAGVAPFSGSAPSVDLLGVALGWLTGEHDPSQSVTLVAEKSVRLQMGKASQTFPIPNRHSVIHSMALRARQLRDRVTQGISSGTLCTPTHAGGWIDPLELVARVQDQQILTQATDFEKVLALLRLAPDRRDQALAALPKSNNEFVSALRYALGAQRISIGSTPWLWVAAARSRSPFTNDPLVEQQHPDLGPDAGSAAQWSQKVKRSQYQQHHYSTLEIDVTPAVPKEIEPRSLTVLLWKYRIDNTKEEPLTAATIGTLFQVWPAAQEAACAVGVLDLADNLDWSEARWNNRLYLQPLLDPDLPLKPLALKLLTLGLAAKAPGEYGLACDVVIAAIDDGRLTGALLGQALADLLPTGLIKAARWAKTLESVSRVSELHHEVIRIAIARSLRGDPDQMPKDLHAYVDLLKELVLESQTAVDEQARQFLEQIAGSGKLAQAAKSILTIKSDAPPDRVLAIRQRVIEQRLLRAERWTAAESRR